MAVTGQAGNKERRTLDVERGTLTLKVARGSSRRGRRDRRAGCGKDMDMQPELETAIRAIAISAGIPADKVDAGIAVMTGECKTDSDPPLFLHELARHPEIRMHATALWRLGVKSVSENLGGRPRYRFSEHRGRYGHAGRMSRTRAWDRVDGGRWRVESHPTHFALHNHGNPVR